MSNPQFNLFASGALSHFAEGEIIRPTQLPVAEKNVIRLAGLPRNLQNRNIYLYLEGKFTGASAQYILGCEVDLRLMGNTRARFPCIIGAINSLATNRSLACLINGGGSAVGNSMVLKLASPFVPTLPDVQVNDATLQPFQITCDIDEAVLHLDTGSQGTSTLIGWRAYLAVVSLGNS